MTEQKSNYIKLPHLVFSPYAYAKLTWFRDAGANNGTGHEIGGYGITMESDPMVVIDFQTIPQDVSCSEANFKEKAIIDHLETCYDMGIQPINCSRVWIHTHPKGMGPAPSSTDETTFARDFAGPDWAIMFILALDGNSTTRLRYREPSVDIQIGACVDYNLPFNQSDHKAWKTEFDKNMFPTGIQSNPMLSNVYSKYNPKTKKWENEVSDQYEMGFYDNEENNNSMSLSENNSNANEERKNREEFVLQAGCLNRIDLQYLALDGVDELYSCDMDCDTICELEYLSSEQQTEAIKLYLEGCTIEVENDQVVYERPRKPRKA